MYFDEITTKMFIMMCPMLWANYQSSTDDRVCVNHWLSLMQLLLKLYERKLYLNITTYIHEHCTYRKYTEWRIRSGYRFVSVAIQLLWPVVSKLLESLLTLLFQPWRTWCEGSSRQNVVFIFKTLSCLKN